MTLVDVGMSSYRVQYFDEGLNKKALRENLDLVEEIKEEAETRTTANKWKIENTSLEE